jgi:hypothetical protein
VPDSNDTFLRRNRVALIFAVFAIILFIIVRFTGTGNDENFLRSEISGRLTKIENHRGGVVITLDSNIEYKFGVAYNENLQPRDFYLFANIGDSIYKRVNSDSIFIVREGRKFGWRLPYRNLTL